MQIETEGGMKRTQSWRGAAAAVVWLGAAATAHAGGLIAYEVGTADVGLASAGYGARAQDASTVFTNPAGMTRLDGSQALVSGQLFRANTQFSVGQGTSPGLGTGDGGYAVGWDGWFVGGGAFFSHRVSPDVSLGFAVAGNFGAPLEYDDNWVGRYYVREGTLLGVSFLPSVAWKATEKLSLGATVNAMYGSYTNRVAINNVNPAFGDGQLKLEDTTFGWGVNLGLLYEVDARTRFGLTWNSEVDLDFEGPAEFSGLAPGISTVFGNRGLLNSSIKVGITVPQQIMGSVFSQVNDRWAILASVGWQEWSRFGQVQLGVDNSLNPVSLTKDLPFKDTWHFAVGAQYRLSDPWLLNFGIAYDTKFQDGPTISPLLPVNDAWRFGAGAQQQLSKTAFWGFAFEYLYGGSLDTNLQSTAPVALGGRGDVVGSFNDTGTFFMSAYYNWQF
jgi:long-chain fatty acid transport protein